MRGDYHRIWENAYIAGIPCFQLGYRKDNYQSGAVGYCFGNDEDHGATPALPDEKTRREYADLGVELINKLVDRFDMPHVVEQMRKLEAYGKENESKYPWMPAAWNDGHR